MVLAPRHPERFAAVAALLLDSGVGVDEAFGLEREACKLASLLFKQVRSFCWILSANWRPSIRSPPSPSSEAASSPAGGHNPLEPAQFGVPIVMGPNYANFRAITDDLRAHNAIRIASKEELARTLIELFVNREDARKMGERARQVFEQQAGATARSIDALREILPSPARNSECKAGQRRAERPA